MSWTVRILIVFWLCFISVIEADLGASCNVNDTSNCTETVESCIDDSCNCSSGHFNVSNVCKSSSITVTLATQSGSVVYGSDVILTATITSEVPLNTIKWLNGSTELVIASPKYTQSDVGPGPITLTIHNVDFTDSGNYKVEVSNLAGTTSTSDQVSLTVTGEKPTVIVPMTISETGTTVTIHCTVSVSQNSPALTAVYWLFNGKNLDISNSNKYSGGIVNNASLSIKNLASTDAGVYHCGATNLLGSTNSSQSVTLAPPSVSVSQPANPVYNDTRIIFSGSYTSTLLNVKSIKWQRMNENAFSDINITEDKYNESTDTGSNPTLVIKKVDFIDKAYFRLTVSNGVGITPSEAVYLNVIDGSISVTLATTSNSARYGSDVILVATITSTTSVNPIKWHKVSDGNHENLDITLSKYTQNGVGPGTVTLTIKNVTFTDGGSYQVEVSNVAGNTDTSNQVSFSVKGGQFDESCTDQQICDTSKNLQCTTLNRCRCTSAFYHNNQLCYQKSRLAPIIIHLNSTTATLSVFWSPPTTDSELVATYEVTWKVNGASIGSSAHLDNSKSRYTVPSGLMSGQIYIVNVISHVNLTNPEQTIVVSSADSEERLTPLAPGPIIMEQSNFAYDNLQVKWTKPSNTFVTGYEVIIDDTKYITRSNELTSDGKNFTPGKYYNVTIVTVSGITDVKKSVKYTKEIRITPTMSSAPTNLTIDGIKSRGFRIQFNRPDDVKGILAAYKIVISEGGNCVQQILIHGICSICKSTVGCQSPINHTVSDITNNDVSYTATGLDPYTHYVVKVVAINGKGEGHPVNKTVWTDEEVPLQPGQVTASNVQSSSLTLAWTLPDPSPGNTTYTIYIYEGIDDNGTSFLMKESIKVYGFETKMLSVTGLEEYWPYKFQVNAATVKGNRTSDFSSVFKTKEAVVKDDETTSTSSIIGSVVAVILVVTVVVIGIFIWKRNQRHKEYKEQAITYADLNLDDLTKVDQPYSLLEHGNRTVNSKSVPLNSFYDYVMDLLNNNRRKLTKEYHDLLQDTERSASTVASSKDNVSKNRGNIIPYDFNRVRLSSPGPSDYIDASVLLDRCYILTSYPIAKTFGNFWQMVWEQNVSTIVVMTGHSDDRESWYFSDNEGTVRTMERIDVELLAKFKSSESVTMRKIKLSRGKHSKVVNHFLVISLEMTDLPDQILALINTITQNNVKNTGPQVVHGGCTGVDNSGVYIAVDYAVKSVVSGGNEIDVYGTARTVMKERMFSISSLEQYSAIHTCLQKYVQNSPACKNDATGAYEYLP